MPLPAGPGPKVHPESGVAAGDGDPAADRHPVQRPPDEEVGAPLEPQDTEVERGARVVLLGHGSYSRAVTVPAAS